MARDGDVSVESLEQLAARAVSGDGAALSALCQRLEGPVYRLCLRMLGDVRDAEDAAQDVLVKVVTHLGSFEGRSALSTWVHQVAVRHVLSVKKSRAEERSLDEAGFEALLEQGLAFAATAPPVTPEDHALLTEVRLSCTQGMLLLLSREERITLVLVELLGFDGSEAAALLDVSHDAFRQRLSRARSRLGTFLRSRCGVVSPEAACHCEKQVPARKALGLAPARLRLVPLVTGDLEPCRDAAPLDVALAAAELKAAHAISAAFHEDGAWAAPGSLRERMSALLPTILRS